MDTLYMKSGAFFHSYMIFLYLGNLGMLTNTSEENYVVLHLVLQLDG